MNRASILILALTVPLAVLVGCDRPEAKANGAMEMPPPRVSAFEAVARDVPVYLDAIGKTVSTDTIMVIPQVGGKLVASPVEDGALVKKGDVLFEIDPRPLQAELSASQAAVMQAKSERAMAILEVDRMKQLEGTNAMSTLEQDQKRLAVEVADAKLKASEANLDMAKLNVEYTRIQSPIDGRAGARMFVAGNVVKANDAPLMNIQKLDPIYAEFTVTENDLGTVRKFLASQGMDLGLTPERGLDVEVDVPGDSKRMLTALSSSTRPHAIPATAPAGPRKGTLTFLDNAVQTETGTVRVRAMMPNADHYFWPGQFVNARLILTVKKAAVMIPVQAQQIGQEGPYVYVIAPDGTADIRQIVPGQRHGDLMVVESGVAAGERVVVTGQMMIMPKGKVDVMPDAPAAPHSK